MPEPWRSARQLIRSSSVATGRSMPSNKPTIKVSRTMAIHLRADSKEQEQADWP